MFKKFDGDVGRQVILSFEIRRKTTLDYIVNGDTCRTVGSTYYKEHELDAELEYLIMTNHTILCTRDNLEEEVNWKFLKHLDDVKENISVEYPEKVIW